jgi:hypothetical protein
MEAEMDRMREEAAALEREMRERIQQVHRSYRRELVPWKPPGEMLRSRDFQPTVRIRIERQDNNNAS